jgi:hypothetical protein
MILEAIQTLLDENDIGTTGVDLFIGDLPATEADCLAVIGSPSPAPNPAIPVFDQYVDFWARYRQPSDAYDMLNTIQDLLHPQANYTMGDYHVYLSNAQGQIDDMGEDSESRKLLKITVRFIYREITQS